MKKRLLSVLFVVTMLSMTCAAAYAADDYPSKYRNAALDAVVDEWNFYNRECTSFVAWCLNNRNGVGFSNWYGGAHWGNAKNWGSAAGSLGISVNGTPAVGAVAWWNSGTYGHVAWVASVSGSNVTIEEYNYSGNGTYNTRTISAGSASGYIHIKDIVVSKPSVTTVSQHYWGSDYNEGWYEGQWSNGKPNGYGKLTYDDFGDGKYYTLDAEDGKSYRAIYYEGQFVDGYRVGSGTMYYEGGYREEGAYYGQWSAGKTVFEGKRWKTTSDSEGYWPMKSVATSASWANDTFGAWVYTKAPHTHSYTTTVTDPTCTAQGYTTHTCSCGESYKDSYTNALGHNYTTTVTNPTCTAQGYTTHSCSCGESYKDSYTAALGHSYQMKVTKEATETNEGIRTYTCSRCKDSYTESIPKLTHTHNYTAAVTAPTCMAQGYTTYTCAACGDSYRDNFTPAGAHSYACQITRTATANSPGLKTYTCSVCGAQYTEEYPAEASALPFTDVPANAYYRDAVAWAYNNNVTLGTTASSFSPGKTCTRAQVVTFLWRAMGEPVPRSMKNPFTDVKSGSYYDNAVRWAVEQGITTGTTADTFSPNKTCSNAHILVFLWRCLGKPMNTGASLWYQDALSWANSAALLNSTSAFSNVNGGCPRSDVVTFLYRAVANR